jgi:CrcB protein
MMYLIVGAGGIIGAILRFLISTWLSNYENFIPFGTLCVNFLGCFIFGYFQGLTKFYYFPKWLVLGFGTGLIGAFTTFSTFSIEVITYILHGDMILSISYMLVSSIIGYYLVFSGFSLASITRWKCNGNG